MNFQKRYDLNIMFLDYLICSQWLIFLFSPSIDILIGFPLFYICLCDNVCLSALTLNVLYILCVCLRCYSLNMNWCGVFYFCWQDDERYFILNTLITGILLQFSEWICPPAIIWEKFLEFIENALLGKVWFLHHYVPIFFKDAWSSKCCNCGFVKSTKSFFILFYK